jgi:hypothetical protein
MWSTGGVILLHGSPGPVVVDVTRDAVDWLVVGVTVVSAVVGVVAIVVALRANRQAKHAESRSRQFAASERRRVFDLEILRDLLDHLDDRDALLRAAGDPSATIRQANARLSMLEPNDLPLWRSMAEMRPVDLPGCIGATADDYKILRYANAEPDVIPDDGFLDKLQAALRADIENAVERRMRLDAQ